MAIDVVSLEKELKKREDALDHILSKSRTAVRHCANSIKSVHARDIDSAESHLLSAEKMLNELKPYEHDFQHQLNHIYQEYVEARVLLSIYQRKGIPSHKSLKVPAIPYINGLMDCIGELKREMYEHLRKGEKKEAEFYFSKMEHIFHTFLHFRYSNAVLPDFRRKQDVARIQIEQARGELL